jgi:hypothetical protein
MNRIRVLWSSRYAPWASITTIVHRDTRTHPSRTHTAHAQASRPWSTCSISATCIGTICRTVARPPGLLPGFPRDSPLAASSSPPITVSIAIQSVTGQRPRVFLPNNACAAHTQHSDPQSPPRSFIIFSPLLHHHLQDSLLRDHRGVYCTRVVRKTAEDETKRSRGQDQRPAPKPCCSAHLLPSLTHFFCSSTSPFRVCRCPARFGIVHYNPWSPAASAAPAAHLYLSPRAFLLFLWATIDPCTSAATSDVPSSSSERARYRRVSSSPPSPSSFPRHPSPSAAAAAAFEFRASECVCNDPIL